MILYKEWLKTRWFLAAAALVLAGATGYALLSVSKTIQINGADKLWAMLLFKETVLIGTLQYIPALLGGLLAAFQFVPETARKRLKLTLHLPFPQGAMIGLMSLYGVLVLTLLFALQTGVLALVLRRWFVSELVARMLLTSVPWLTAGYAAYLWVAALCLEPSWRARIVLLLLLSALLRILFLSNIPESYNPFLPGLVAYVCGGVLLLYRGVARFKEGIQD